jgi:hypothetical protein
MRDRNQPSWVGWDRNADVLAAQCAEDDWPTWVVRTERGDVVGVTTTSFVTPFLGWTEREQAEPALFLQSTVTHPRLAGTGLGTAIAFWALDQGARNGRAWVRRGVLTRDRQNLGLVRHYRSQGWRVARAVVHPRRCDVTVWSLQRPTERQDRLASLIRS